MSKIITPPQIDDLDGLLDLLLHPQKMVAYLTQLRDMRDAVNESLDAYNTKAKADALLVQAAAKHEEAMAASLDASDMVDEAKKDVAAMKASFEKDKAQWEAERQRKHRELVARETEVQKAKQTVQVATANLSTREGELQAKHAILIAQQSALKTEQDKIQKAHETLATLRG